MSQDNDIEVTQNYWSVYIGNALTDPDVPPATVMVSETFHKCLLSGNPGAWRMLVQESEKFIIERQTDEDSIY